MNRGDPLRISPYQAEAGSSVGVECKHTEWETFWETKFLTQQSVRHVAVRALLLAATCKSFKADSAP